MVSAPGTAQAVNAQCSLAMGEGLTPLPSKLVKKIKALKYVEMSEPESWLLQEKEQATSSGAFSLFRRKKGPITDIL